MPIAIVFVDHQWEGNNEKSRKSGNYKIGHSITQKEIQ